MSLQIILKNSSVSGQEPTASQLANGELALNYHADGPFISCKDTAGVVRRIAGVWISTTAPTSPQPGEFWLDTNTTPARLKVYKDSTDTWIDTIPVPVASTTTAGIVELATDLETQTGADTLRAVTPASLQSKISDSTSTTSSTTIASSTAVKAAKDIADAALPATGGTISGDLVISGDLTVNGTETILNVDVLQVEDKTIEMGVVSSPTDITANNGGVVLKGTSDKTILWADSTDSWTSSENVDLASGKTYKIAGTDVLSATALGSGVTGSSLTSVGTITSGTWNGTQIATNYIADGAITSDKIADGTIVNADVNASAAIAGTKISPDFGSQNTITTGTSTAASFIPTSSTVPANGVYLPSANNLAFATNSTERLRIDSSGRLGLGTATPTATLHTASGSSGATPSVNADDLFIETNGNTGITIGGSTSSSCSIRFADSASSSVGGIYYDHSTDAFDFATAGLNRLRIDSSGRLGLGTTAPTVALHVATTGTPQFRLEDLDTANAYVNVSASNGNFVIQADPQNVSGSTRIGFEIDGSEHARIDSSGRLGLGTTSPSAPLHLNSSSNNMLFLESSDSIADIIGADTTGSTRIRSEGGELSLWTGGTASSSTAASATEHLRVTSTGLVGLGTTSPADLLHVASGNIRISDSGATQRLLRLSNGSGATEYRIEADGNSYLYNDGYLAISAGGGTERARLDSSGRLLVGTSTARTNLGGTSAGIQLEGIDDTSRKLAIISSTSGNSNAQLILAAQRSGTVGGNTIVGNNANLGMIQFMGSDGTNFVPAAYIQSETDSTPGAGVMPGRLIFSTNSGASGESPTERVRLTSNGALLVGTTSTPTGAGSGAVVAQDRVVIGSVTYGRCQTLVGDLGSITATTGTVVFKFKGAAPTGSRACYVKLSIANRSTSNTVTNNPAAEYAFQLHHTSGGVCTLNGATTIFEYTYVRATHFAFANLGSGECTVTLTNPTNFNLNGTYKVEILVQSGFWGLDSVTVT